MLPCYYLPCIISAAKVQSAPSLGLPSPQSPLIYLKCLWIPHSQMFRSTLLFGSIFLGIGIAVLLRQGVSNGGVGVIALIIAKYKNINPGKSLFWINGVIFVITGYVIVWEIIIQALICQWVSTTIVRWLYQCTRAEKKSDY